MIDTIRTDQGNVREFVDLAGGGGGGGGGEMLKIERHLSPADLNAMGLPLVLVPGVPGVWYVPMLALARHNGPAWSVENITVNIDVGTPYTDYEHLSDVAVEIDGNIINGANDGDTAYAYPGSNNTASTMSEPGWWGQPLCVEFSGNETPDPPCPVGVSIDLVVWYTAWTAPA